MEAGCAADAVEHRYRTLLVDDVPSLRTLIRVTLELDGRFEVVAEADDGRTAVDFAREHQPDVVLLDVSMPEQGGLEVLPAIRAAAPATRVVMLSALEAKRLARLALDRGAIAYLEKGLSPESIVAELVAVLEGGDERCTVSG
jgi:DNA-binding NarL/FixJ family response regulator